jgi:hypothetical protein
MSERYVARSTAIAARMLGGEMMIMSAVDSTFFTLNEVATVIWQSADGITPLSAIVHDRICSEFDVDAASALRDATEFVDELAKHKIVAVSDRPIVTRSAQEPAP